MVSLAGLSKGATDMTEATAVTAANHGFGEGDMVTILAPTSGDDRFYNGTFPIYSVTSYTFKYRMLIAPTSARETDGLSPVTVVSTGEGPQEC